MKILFIYPNAGSQLGFNYGLSHISAVLKRAGHMVEMIQLCEEMAALPSDEEFISLLKKSSPDIIGFSVVTNQWIYTKMLAKIAKETLNAIVVCGGVHATVATEEVVNSALFDYVFAGECEEVFLDFVNRLERGMPVESVNNMSYLSNGKIISNPLCPLPDLTKLPAKDYEVFNFQKLIDAKNGWVGLMASRGCPFSCTYCFNHKMVEKYRSSLNCSFAELNYIRHFPLEKMLAEIKYLLDNYKNIKMFIFDDDLFTYNKKYLLEFCKEYKKLSKLPFVVNGHVGFFDEERAVALADANCKIVKFGLESGSEKIRRAVMNRHMNNESIKKAIEIVNIQGMHSSVFVMLGIPHETKDDLWQTIKLLAISLPGRFRWTYFFPYPGTESYNLANNGGFIDFDKMKNLLNFTDESCINLGEEENLLLKKIGLAMPWFVNAESKMECAPYYLKQLEKILDMNAETWGNVKTDEILAEDRKISAQMQKKGLPHYAIKYNRFMGVISDYFMHAD